MPLGDVASHCDRTARPTPPAPGCCHIPIRPRMALGRRDARRGANGPVSNKESGAACGQLGAPRARPWSISRSRWLFPPRTTHETCCTSCAHHACTLTCPPHPVLRVVVWEVRPRPALMRVGSPAQRGDGRRGFGSERPALIRYLRAFLP